MDERQGIKKRIPGHRTEYLSNLEVSQALPAAHKQLASGFICHGVICGLQATLIQTPQFASCRLPRIEARLPSLENVVARISS